MASELLMMARREADALRSALAKNQDYQKLQLVQRLIDVYEAYDAVGERVPETVTSARPKEKAKATPPARTDTKLSQVEKTVLDHMRRTGQRASSGQLLPLLIEVGIELGGKVPSKTLASMLSNSARLNNMKGFGYGPKEWGDKPWIAVEKNEAPPAIEQESASQITGSEAQTSLPIHSGNDQGAPE